METECAATQGMTMNEPSVQGARSTSSPGLPAIRMNFELEGKRIGYAHVMHEGGEIVVRHVHIEAHYLNHPYAFYCVESLKRTADAIVIEDPGASERDFWRMTGLQSFGGRIMFWRRHRDGDDLAH